MVHGTIRTKFLAMRRSKLSTTIATACFLLVVLIIWGPGILADIKLRLEAYRGTPVALYLDSGHIFYGKLHAISSHTIELTDVRSFQKFEVGDSTTNTLQAQVSNPITHPDNLLIIERSHLLFFEKIGPLSPILSNGGSVQ